MKNKKWIETLEGDYIRADIIIKITIIQDKKDKDYSKMLVRTTYGEYHEIARCRTDSNEYINFLEYRNEIMELVSNFFLND